MALPRRAPRRRLTLTDWIRQHACQGAAINGSDFRVTAAADSGSDWTPTSSLHPPSNPVQNLLFLVPGS